MQSMQVNRGEDVGNLRDGYIQFGQQFQLAASDAGIDTQLSSGIYETLLQYWQGNDSGAISPVFCH